jgi:hypothetical protein
MLLVLVGLFSTLANASSPLNSPQNAQERGRGQSARYAAVIGMNKMIAELNHPAIAACWRMRCNTTPAATKWYSLATKAVKVRDLLERGAEEALVIKLN